MKFVNVYLVQQAYGGPEEGGWWHDYGVPYVSVPEGCPGGLDGQAAHWREWCEAENASRPDYTHSNGYGEYRVSVENHPALGWPSERPFYE